ncbi:hypothetical protein LX32DRAFT_685165 [Colletotrichum zoysiae]|uniref:Uncharacterized protein n=1 Tax=Colletotrichum zoysiae TaxID=1216348 RepID=A0AAD9HBU0_9PEZI|nr:hypothetical protein LX32DRAFT_685165 [Colletotrichum zoysiae]
MALTATVISVGCPSCANSQSYSSTRCSSQSSCARSFPTSLPKGGTIPCHPLPTTSPMALSGSQAVIFPVCRACLLGCLWAEPKLCIMWLTAHDDNMITCQCGFTSCQQASSSRALKRRGGPALATAPRCYDIDRSWRNASRIPSGGHLMSGAVTWQLQGYNVWLVDVMSEISDGAWTTGTFGSQLHSKDSKEMETRAATWAEGASHGIGQLLGTNSLNDVAARDRSFGRAWRDTWPGLLRSNKLLVLGFGQTEAIVTTSMIDSWGTAPPKTSKLMATEASIQA